MRISYETVNPSPDIKVPVESSPRPAEGRPPILFFRPDVDKLFSRRNVKGLIKALRYKKDESIQLKAKECLIAIGKEAGEAIVSEYQSSYDHRPIENEYLEETLVEICKRSDSILDGINDAIIASRDWNWLRENLEDVLVNVGEKAIVMLIREADRRRGGIPLVEGTLHKMGKIAVGPLSEVAREGVKYPHEVKRILQEINGGPIDFEITDNPSQASAILNHMESMALRSAMSSCSTEDLNLLQLKIKHAQERGVDAVDVSSFLPDFKRKVRIDDLEKILDNVLEASGKTQILRHSRESGSPERIEKTGFPPPRE